MPQRFLRPGITNSDNWNAVSFEAQSLYIRILTLVDDFGRCDGRIPVLHGQCFALRPDIKPKRTEVLRTELHDCKLIQVYSVDGKEYVQVLRWQERARTDKSKFPDPQDSAADRSVPLAKDASLAITSSPLHPRSLVAADAAEPERAKGRGTVEELKAFCVSLGLPELDGTVLFEKWQGVGWRNGGAVIKDWRATIRAWKAQGYMPSQKKLNNGRNQQHPRPGTDRNTGTCNEGKSNQYGED